MSLITPTPLLPDEHTVASPLTNASVQTQHAAAVVDPVLAATAVLAVKAASLTAEALLPLIVLATSNSQPLLSLIQEYRVHMNDECLGETLVQLDALIHACETSLDRQAGRAPGFWSRTEGPNLDAIVNRTWTKSNDLPYETLDLHDGTNTSLPVPSIYSALQCYQAIRSVLAERMIYLEAAKQQIDVSAAFCSCISRWGHVSGSTAIQLANQTMEQLMAREASERLHQRIAAKGGVEAAYDAQYDNNSEVALDYHSSISLCLLTDRDKYMSLFTRACLASTEIIQISTCYVFWNDPAQQYILFDLLPYMVRTKGVRVQILFDLIVMESTSMKSVFYSTKGTKETTRASAVETKVTASSFWNHLPENCPVASKEKFQSADDFFQGLMDFAAVNEKFEIQFWCARDAQEQYRIKNHAKCSVFDKRVAIIGGSNLTPTIKSATADLDCLVTGSAAAAVSQSFESLYNSMSRKVKANIDPVQELAEEKKDDDELMNVIRNCPWDDNDCKVAILRSTPSCEGDDSIYRVVLDKIRSAKSYVCVYMGHSCYPMSFSRVVKDATDRGVRVRIIVNSLYSNDLRGGQRDLILSIRDMLQVAPEVEVYATTMPHMRDPSIPESESARPEFLHAKFVVVDDEWSAVGSWNLWNRSCFYEIEHEAFIESQKIARILLQKFELDQEAHCVRLKPEDCVPGGQFCPKGCFICQGFGPFYVE